MARTSNSGNKPKGKKKPSNQQHKTVYFNTNNINDVALYQYAQSVGVRNFSGWIKSLIYQEMIRRNGQPPNPYEYAGTAMEPVKDIPNKTVQVPVQRKEMHEEPELDDVSLPEENEQDDVHEEVFQEEEDFEVNKGEEEQVEEEPQNTVRSKAAAAMASMYKRS